MILRQRHYGLIVSDMAKARAFYEGVLGFTHIITRHESSPYFRKVNNVTVPANMVKLAIPGGQVLELVEFENMERVGYLPLRAGLAHACFQVADINAVYLYMVMNQVKIISAPIESDDGAKVMTILDPDHNKIELVEIPDGCVMPRGLQ